MTLQKWMTRLAKGGCLVLTASLSVSCAQPEPAEAPSTTETAGVQEQEKGGSEVTGHYEVDRDWPQPIHLDWTSGRTGGVWAAAPDRIFVVQTGELPVLEGPRSRAGVPVRNAVDHPETRTTEHRFLLYDGAGNLIESWEQHNHLFVHPHSVKMSPYDPDHVWVVDGRSESGVCAEQVWKFTMDGQLVMTLGEHGVPGNDETHFAGPTDLAFLPNGDFYVADGYKNGRVVKFSADGAYLSEFGTRGREPGQFTQVHGIAVDSEGRIYTADRGNSRVQVFDSDGMLLDIWPNIPFPMDLAVTNDGHVWVADGMANKFLKFDLDGHLLYVWGTLGAEPGRVWGTHRFSVDSEGNLYTAEVWGGRAQKFRPKPGADPEKLIGSFLGFQPLSNPSGTGPEPSG